MDRIISEDTLQQHIRELIIIDPAFERVFAKAGDVPLRWLDPGLAGLVWVVTGQQISIAAGRAIYNRLEAALGNITAEALAAAPDETLREAGYSRGKIATIRSIQAAILDGQLDLELLHNAPAENAVATLCAIKGIGPWTAEVYLLFAVGHPDIFPAADVALQEAARLAFGADARPCTKELREMAQAWIPRRSAAARVLWSYYREVKNPGGGLPV